LRLPSWQNAKIADAGKRIKRDNPETKLQAIPFKYCEETRHFLFTYLFYIKDTQPNNHSSKTKMIEKIHKTDEEWKKLLGPERYIAMRENGTEPAFKNAYWNNEEAGIYHCAACDLPLFHSEDKFNSHTGWPSFTQPIAADHVELHKDCSLPDPCRTAVSCARCESHLGHVFDDGPEPTGERFCMNSIALNFEKI